MRRARRKARLGADARAVASQQGLEMVPDPLPDRNVFIRTDQFSFVREGVPALVFKFGFAKDTPEFDIEHDWRANRYHAPSDDLEQPVMKEEAVKLDAFVAALAKRIADADARPSWLPDSIFRKDNLSSGSLVGSASLTPMRAGARGAKQAAAVFPAAV